MTSKLDGLIYEPILHEIQRIPHVKIINHSMVDNKGHDTELAEIVVGFDIRKKYGWRGVLLGKTEPVVNLGDIMRHIQSACGHRPFDDNDRRLFYKIKEKIDGKEKLLYCLEISTTPLFI